MNNQTQTLATTTTASSNTAVALPSAWQQEWLTAYNALPVKAGMTAMEVCALQTTAPAVCILNRGAADTQAGIDVFMAELVRISRFAGVGWDDFQIETAAELLYDEYYHWTFAELKHFTLRVMKADFKCQKDFTKLAPKHIMLCAAEHANAVIDARMDYNRCYTPPATATAGLLAAPVKEVTPEEMTAAMQHWQDLQASIRARLAAERDAEEARLRTERAQHAENLLRRYCKNEGLDYEVMKKEVEEGVEVSRSETCIR